MSQYPIRSGPITNDAATFSQEMVQGTTFPKPRLFLGPNKTPFPCIDPSFGPAASPSPEMFGGAQGVSFPAPRLLLGIRTLQPLYPLDEPFSIAMVAGNHPDSPRIRLGPRIPLPISQPTHVNAPFSQEMVAGWQPLRPRLFLGPRIGPPLMEANFAVPEFSIEMVSGNAPSTSRARQRSNASYIVNPLFTTGGEDVPARLFLSGINTGGTRLTYGGAGGVM